MQENIAREVGNAEQRGKTNSNGNIRQHVARIVALSGH